MFRTMRRFATFIDFSFPSGTKRGEIKKIAKASSEMINDEGFTSYSRAVKEKIKRKEMKVITPLTLSEHEKQSLEQLVNDNKKTRLKIKAHSYQDIKNDEFKDV